MSWAYFLYFFGRLSRKNISRLFINQNDKLYERNRLHHTSINKFNMRVPRVAVVLLQMTNLSLEQVLQASFSSDVKLRNQAELFLEKTSQEDLV